MHGFLQRHEGAAIVLLMLAGLVERIVWVSGPGRLAPFVSEMQRVAVSFARTGVLGDAYFNGQGPTAHVGPVMPILAGAVYRLFGVGSPTSEIVLVALALSFLAIALLAFYAAFRRLGLAVEWRLLALATALLLPLYFKFEAQSLRIWEGALAVALLACSLALTLRLDARRELAAKDYILPAVLSGFLALVSPPAALGAYGAFGVLTLKRVPVRRWPAVALVMALGLALFIAPWAIRNERALGRPILTRSNFPLEHAIGFHPAAVDPASPRDVYVARLNAIHPYSGEVYSAARDQVAHMGELAYMDRLHAETSAWERAHPADAARLAGRYFREFWFPPRWLYRIYGDQALVIPRVAFTWATALAAFAALAWGLVREPLGPRLYVACALILPSLPYALVQPVQRYRYLVAALTLFLAAEFLARLYGVVARGRAPAPADRAG